MLNDTERKVLSDLLKLASDEFSNNGCNDYRLENTDENWALHMAVETWANEEESRDERRPTNPKEPIYAVDWLLMSYFASRLADDEDEVDGEENVLKDWEQAKRARAALQAANGYASEALKRGDLHGAVQQIALGAYYLGHLHVFENRQFDPTSEIEDDVDDAHLHALMNRAHALVPKAPSSAAASADAPVEMNELEVLHALDDLMKRDAGVTRPGTRHDVLRGTVKKWLRKDEKRTGSILRLFLRDALDYEPNGPESVARRIHWLRDHMDYDLS